MSTLLQKNVFFIFLVFSSLNAAPCENKVTYRLSGGRFGDNLLAYMHAKWVSYRYGMPLIYQDFPYAEELMLEKYEEKTDPSCLKQKIFKQRDGIDAFIDSLECETLCIVPYFPESFYELSIEPSFSYFRVNWENSEFKAILKKMITSKKEMKRLSLPQGRISVALHIRRGPGFDGGYDSLLSTKSSFPLKFPSEHFYMNAIKHLCAVFKTAPLYIHVFTDDIVPLSLLNRFKMEFKDYDILWGCRETGNHWCSNVLEDFFALTEFDCSIHGESNFPLSAGKIADYQIEIMPMTFHWEGLDAVVDNVILFGNNKKIISEYESLMHLNFIN